jgi:hypothetical protein
VRRATLLVTAIGVVMLLASGVALAATFDGTPGPDTFVGTPCAAKFAAGEKVSRYNYYG